MSDIKWISLVLAFCIIQLATPIYADEADVLLKFRTSLSNDAALNTWDKSKGLPCTVNHSNWFGVLCDDSGAIWGVNLESISLAGIIDIDTLVQLPFLRILSFADNSFDGPLPQVNKLKSLRAIFLNDNKFSGEIPDQGFLGMNYLKNVYLGGNQFSGPLPSSLVNLPRLLQLNVARNLFSGPIPDFKQPLLQFADFSYNNFEGKIPESLVRMGSNSFNGNKDLCGKPLPVKCKSSGNRP